MKIATALSTIPAVAFLSMPVAAVAGSVTPAQPGHQAFLDSVVRYEQAADPVCGLAVDAALTAGIAARDKKFVMLSAQIAASPLAEEFAWALRDVRRRQAVIAEMVDCAEPTIERSRSGFNESLIALDQLERAWRDAPKG